jgi:hypothetical protein
VERTRLRVGDGAQMAIIAFVDEIKDVAKPAATTPVTKPVAKKPAAAKEAK